MLRELDTEAACQAHHMSASRASFVFPTSSIPLPVRRQCLGRVDGRGRMGRRAARRAEGRYLIISHIEAIAKALGVVRAAVDCKVVLAHHSS